MRGWRETRAEYSDCAYHSPVGFLMQLRKVSNDVLARGVTGGGNRNRLHHHWVTSIRLFPLVRRTASMVRKLARTWLVGTWMDAA